MISFIGTTTIVEFVNKIMIYTICHYDTLLIAAAAAAAAATAATTTTNYITYTV